MRDGQVATSRVISHTLRYRYAGQKGTRLDDVPYRSARYSPDMRPTCKSSTSSLLIFAFWTSERRVGIPTDM